MVYLAVSCEHHRTMEKDEEVHICYDYPCSMLHNGSDLVGVNLSLPYQSWKNIRQCIKASGTGDILWIAHFVEGRLMKMIYFGIRFLSGTIWNKMFQC